MQTGLDFFVLRMNTVFLYSRLECLQIRELLFWGTVMEVKSGCGARQKFLTCCSQRRQVHEIIVGWYINNNKSKKLDFKQ